MAEYGASGIYVRIDKNRKVTWVKREGDTYSEIRIPSPHSYKKDLGINFVVEGKEYPYLRDLYHEKVEEARRMYRDIHGRIVLDMKDRYPCFDSYDFATENRYYHWYLILTENTMSMVYSDDGKGEIEVVEDIGILAYSPYDILKFWHYLDKDGILRLY